MERFAEVARKTKEYGMQLRGTVSCAFGFYGDEVTPEDVTEVVANFRELDCDEINIADTIGVATPNQVHNLLKHLKQEVAVDQLSMHFHDTYGQGVGNICASLQAGITTFDASVAGLGGCPFSRWSGRLPLRQRCYRECGDRRRAVSLARIGCQDRCGFK